MKNMVLESDTCRKCGRTKSQIIADARSLGVLEELQSGVYTCCEVSQWADEQWLAWFEATQEDDKILEEVTIRPEFTETNLVLVPVRLRRQQVPWYRNPDHLD
jgi:hypothetical protein